jgi:hypothetical protein
MSPTPPIKTPRKMAQRMTKKRGSGTLGTSNHARLSQGKAKRSTTSLRFWIEKMIATKKANIQKSVLTHLIFSSSLLGSLFPHEIGKGRVESLIRFLQVFGDDLRFRHHRHKIGISRPARYNMEMEMIFSGTSYSPDIHSDIEPIGTEARLQHLYGSSQ